MKKELGIAHCGLVCCMCLKKEQYHTPFIEYWDFSIRNTERSVNHAV